MIQNYSPAFLPGLVTYVYTLFLCISGSFVNLLFCSFCLWFCDSFRQISQYHSTAYSDRMQLFSVDKFRQFMSYRKRDSLCGCLFFSIITSLYVPRKILNILLHKVSFRCRRKLQSSILIKLHFLLINHP